MRVHSYLFALRYYHFYESILFNENRSPHMGFAGKNVHTTREWSLKTKCV